MGLVGNRVLLNRAQQQRTTFRGVDGFHHVHGLSLEARGDLFAGVHHLSATIAVAGQHLAVGDQVQLAGAHDDFAKNVVLLGDRDDAGGLAEDVLDDLSAGLDPLTVLDHQQGDVLVDLVGFLGDPQQGAALIDLVAVLGAAGFFDRQARSEFDQTTGLGAEAVIRQLSDHLAIGDLGAGLGVEAIAGAVLALEVPDLTAMGRGGDQLAVLQREAAGDDLHFTGITLGFAQAHRTTEFGDLPAFRQHLTGFDVGAAFDHWHGVGRQVVDVAAEHPHAAETLGLEGDVALTIGHLFGLNDVLITDLTSQVAHHILGGFLNALLDR